jgi:iron complex outermembrane receptor protein
MKHKTEAARRQPITLALLALLAAQALPVAAQSDPADLSLEELLNVEVRTASRKAQRLQDVAAAVFVITREDIERSGATSLPEVLRLAPGVQVARLANSRWAVSARGFNGRFANKLLVLMDGRSIYSPLFSGVLWELEDTLLEDIDRIEVIRGPGAALWGANAVNGVINIITRHARDTRDALVVAGAGSEEKGFGALRQGLAIGDGHLRLWAKSAKRDASLDAGGAAGPDDWRATRAGIRSDLNLDTGRRLTVIGGVYQGTTGDRWMLPSLTALSGIVPIDIEQRGTGGHALLRHDWTPADGSQSTLQVYVDRSDLEVPGVLREQRTTVDLDFQRRIAPRELHDVIWGLSHRHSRDRIASHSIISIRPERQTYTLTSAFVHDEITLRRDALRMVLGARLEHNSYTGLEPQPNARLMWTPTAHQAAWAAVSRAVRTPSRAEKDSTLDLQVIPGGGASPPVLLRSVSTPVADLKAERVTALEFGYRHRFDAQLSLDVAVFHNRYDQLRGGQLSGQYLAMVPFPHVVQEITMSYALKGRTSGLELVADWHAAPWLRLQGGYGLLQASIFGPSGNPIGAGAAQELENSAPRHQASLRGSISLSGRQQFDFWLRHVGRLRPESATSSGVPAYTTLDLRYAWRPSPSFELSLVGQNLLDARHAEFVPDLLPSQTAQIERGWYVKGRWQF